VLYSSSAIATEPLGAILGPEGAVYVGTMDAGDNDDGAIFQLQPPRAPGEPWSTSVVYSFPGPGAEQGEENEPWSLILGPNGAFYGTIGFGGAPPTYPGAVFEVRPPAAPGGAWTQTILHNFQADTDGSTPNSLTAGSDGTLYGTTFGTPDIAGYPGPYGLGTAFMLTPPAVPGGSWTKTTLAQLSAGDERGPNSPLILRNGNLYGTTSSGPSNPGGMVFELKPPTALGDPWTTTYLHGFDDTMPGGTLVMDESGALYGATQAFFTAPAQGIVYRIAPE
jgi:hypothetical protein